MRQNYKRIAFLMKKGEKNKIKRIERDDLELVIIQLNDLLLKIIILYLMQSDDEFCKFDLDPFYTLAHQNPWQITRLLQADSFLSFFYFYFVFVMWSVYHHIMC